MRKKAPKASLVVRSAGTFATFHSFGPPRIPLRVFSFAPAPTDNSKHHSKKNVVMILHKAARITKTIEHQQQQ